MEKDQAVEGSVEKKGKGGTKAIPSPPQRRAVPMPQSALSSPPWSQAQMRWYTGMKYWMDRSASLPPVASRVPSVCHTASCISCPDPAINAPGHLAWCMYLHGDCWGDRGGHWVDVGR